MRLSSKGQTRSSQEATKFWSIRHAFNNYREFLRASPKYRHEHVLKYGAKLYWKCLSLRIFCWNRPIECLIGWRVIQNCLISLRFNLIFRKIPLEINRPWINSFEKDHGFGHMMISKSVWSLICLLFDSYLTPWWPLYFQLKYFGSRYFSVIKK